MTSLFCCGDQEAGAERTKEATIRELLEITGAAKIGVQVIDHMGAMLASRTNDPDFSAFWAEFVKSVDPSALEDMILPIYARHFEQDELVQMIKFYETPAGRKCIAKLPEIMQESMEAGGKWGEELAEKALRRFAEQKEQEPK